MIRTQIQLPDELYRELKALADDKEWSLAETLRRGAELLLRSYPHVREAKDAWSLPPAVPLGRFRQPHARWREHANATSK